MSLTIADWRMCSVGRIQKIKRGLGHMENLQIGERSLVLRQQGGHWDPRAFWELVSYVSSLGKLGLGMECPSGRQGLECHLLHPQETWESQEPQHKATPHPLPPSFPC